MSTDSQDPLRDLKRVIDAAIESLWESSDAEVLQETQAAGEDPLVTADHARGLLLGAVRAHRRHLMTQARTEYEQQVVALQQRAVALPATAAERLALLTATLAHQPELQSALTIQHRELRSLPDDDVTSYLRQFAELGVLDAPWEPDGDS